MAQLHRITRRTFLAEISHGVVAIAVLGPLAAACTSAGEDGTSTTTTGGDTGDDSTTTTGASTSQGGGAVAVHRVSLDFVSAYLLMRGREAAVVDTGVSGSEGEIERGLAELGLAWSDVGHVILTHLHADHIGSLGAVMTAASDAVGYAGAADIPGITSPRPLTPVGDGDVVFGMDVLATPGHTAGHISVLDRAAGILVAGDALNGAEGGVAGPDPQYSADHEQAIESAKKLATFTYDRAFFGHGEPIEAGASELVAALAATL